MGERHFFSLIQVTSVRGEEWVKECATRYIQLARETFGPEPEGALLELREFPAGDLGFEKWFVVCYYTGHAYIDKHNEIQGEISASFEYAHRCAEETKKNLEEIFRKIRSCPPSQETTEHRS